MTVSIDDLSIKHVSVFVCLPAMGNSGSVSLLQSHMSGRHISLRQCTQTGAVAPITAVTCHQTLPIVAFTTTRPSNVTLMTAQGNVALIDEMPHMLDEADTVAHTVLLLSSDRIVTVASRLLQCFTAVNDGRDFSAESVELTDDERAVTAAASAEYSGRFVFIGTANGTIRVFDSVKGRMSDYSIQTASASEAKSESDDESAADSGDASAVTAIAVMPNDYSQILAGRSDGAIVSYQTATKRRHRQYAITDSIITVASGVSALAWNSAGDRFVSGHDDGLIAVWKRTAVTPEARFFLSSALSAVALTQSRHRVHQIRWPPPPDALHKYNDGFYVAGGNVKDAECGHVVYVSNNNKVNNNEQMPTWTERNVVADATDKNIVDFTIVTPQPTASSSSSVIVIALNESGVCSVYHPSITPLPPPIPLSPVSDSSMAITALYTRAASAADDIKLLNALLTDLTMSITPYAALHQTVAALQRQRLSLWPGTQQVNADAESLTSNSSTSAKTQPLSSLPLPLLVCTAHAHIVQIFDATNALTFRLVCSFSLDSMVEWSAAKKKFSLVSASTIRESLSAAKPAVVEYSVGLVSPNTNSTKTNTLSAQDRDRPPLTIVSLHFDLHKRQLIVGCASGDVFAFDYNQRSNETNANSPTLSDQRATQNTSTRATSTRALLSTSDTKSGLSAARSSTDAGDVLMPLPQTVSSSFLIPPRSESAEPSPSPEPSLVSNAATAGSSQPPSPVSDGGASDVSEQNVVESPELAPTDTVTAQQPDAIDLRASRSPSPPNATKSLQQPTSMPQQFFFEPKYALSVSSSAVTRIESAPTEDRTVIVDSGGISLINSSSGKLIKAMSVKAVTFTHFSSYALFTSKHSATFYLYICTASGAIYMLDARTGDQIGFIPKLHDGTDTAPLLTLTAMSIDSERIMSSPAPANASKPRSASLDHKHMPHEYVVAVSSDAIRIIVADTSKPLVIHSVKTPKPLIHARIVITPHIIQPMEPLLSSETVPANERKPSADAKRYTLVSANPSRESAVVAFDEDMALCIFALMDLTVVYTSRLTVPPDAVSLCNIAVDGRIVYAPSHSALIQAQIFPSAAYGQTGELRIAAYTPPSPAPSEPTSTSHARKQIPHTTTPSPVAKKSGFSFASIFKRGSAVQLTSHTLVASLNVPSPAPSHLDILSAKEPTKTGSGGGDELEALLDAHEAAPMTTDVSPVNIVAEIEQMQSKLRETRARLEAPSTVGGRLRAASDSTAERSQSGKAVAGVNAVAASNVTLAASNLQRLNEMAERSDQLQSASADFAAAARARLKEAEANAKRSFLGIF